MGAEALDLLIASGRVGVILNDFSTFDPGDDGLDNDTIAALLSVEGLLINPDVSGMKMEWQETTLNFERGFGGRGGERGGRRGGRGGSGRGGRSGSGRGGGRGGRSGRGGGRGGSHGGSGRGGRRGSGRGGGRRRQGDR